MRFELLNELGRGATGVVFKARDRETGEVVALKRLLPQVGFPQREVRLARNGTVKVMDFGLAMAADS